MLCFCRIYYRGLTANLNPRSGEVRNKLETTAARGALCALLSLAMVLSTGLAAAAKQAPGPPPPEGLEVFDRQEDQGLRVTLSWNDRGGCAGYKVYRSTTLEGPYREVGGLSSATMKEFPFFLDDTASAGLVYYYRVSSVAGDWSEGPPCAPVMAKMGKGRKGSAPGKSIVVSLADQRVYFFENGVVVSILRCSTGAGGTPTGSYRIQAHRGTVSGCNYWMDWRPNYGMHAWPSYLGAYEENLGLYPRSHGCVRLHPLEASWPYNWAPDGTPFTVIPNSGGKLPLAGAHCTNGATAPSQTWYFAEGFINADFMEYLLFFNPGEEPVNALTTYHPEGREPIVENYLLPPGSRQTISVNGVSGMPSSIGHATSVQADGPIVVQQSEYYNWAGRRGGGTTIGATAPSNTWYFAEGFCGGLFHTFLLLFNPGDKEATVHVSYIIEGGNPYFHDFTMPPDSRGTTWVNALPGLSGKGVSIRVDSSEPLVAQRTMFFDWSGQPYQVNGGDAAMGMTEPAKTWYLAEGCTGYYFDEYILILNPTAQMATINVEFDTTRGPVPYACQVPPFARGTISVDSIPGLQSVETGAVVSSDTDIIVERSMYYTRDSRRGGHVANGVNETSKDWYFAEGFTGGTFDEYVMVMNPGADPASVTYLFHLENGADVGATFLVGPKSRFTVHADDIPGVQWVGSAVEVHSDRPVVAEQAHYFCIPR